MRNWAPVYTQCRHISSSLRAVPRSTKPVPTILARPDPFALLAPELSRLRGRLLRLLGSAHPGLSRISESYFIHPSQQLRPLLVFLFAQATNGRGRDWAQKRLGAQCETIALAAELDSPLSHPDVLHDWNPNMPDHISSFGRVFPLNAPIPPSRVFSELRNDPNNEPFLLPTQIRLGQIVEMIHVASELHDDVLDGHSAVPHSFLHTLLGNKLAVLGGDFLLGRASTALSRLDESEVVELLASVIANVMEGKFWERRPVTRSLDEAWDAYMRMAYLKTASLTAKASRAAVVLGGYKDGQLCKDAAYEYGKNLGLAFQLMNDACGYFSESRQRTTALSAPLLFAWGTDPEVGEAMNVSLASNEAGDSIRDLVHASSGVAQTMELAEKYCRKAQDTLKILPESDAKAALGVLAEWVGQRTWYIDRYNN